MGIFSLIKDGSQEKLDFLEKILKTDLSLNLKKTKVIIFDKQGNTIKKCKFYYSGKVIEIASQYNYLGFTFVPSGKNMLALRKARKHGF